MLFLLLGTQSWTCSKDLHSKNHTNSMEYFTNNPHRQKRKQKRNQQLSPISKLSSMAKLFKKVIQTHLIYIQAQTNIDLTGKKPIWLQKENKHNECPYSHSIKVVKILQLTSK